MFVGKRACVPFGAAALKALSELLEHDDQEVCVCVCVCVHIIDPITSF